MKKGVSIHVFARCNPLEDSLSKHIGSCKARMVGYEHSLYVHDLMRPLRLTWDFPCPSNH